MDARILIGEDVRCAQSLAAKVLVKEQGWRIPSPNPTRLRVEDGLLLDDYDSTAAWFGVFDADELVGCLRVCSRLEGEFELERYWREVPSFITDEPAAWEATRFAIAPSHRLTDALLSLAHATSVWLLERDARLLFATSHFPRPGINYTETFGFTKLDSPFRYHPDDAEEAYPLFMRRPRIEAMVQNLARRLSSP